MDSLRQPNSKPHALDIDMANFVDLSPHQRLFRDFLVARLGFRPGDAFAPKYQQLLATRRRDFVSLAAREIQRDPCTSRIVLPSDHEYRKYVERGNFLVPTSLGLVDILLIEYRLKQRYHQPNRSLAKPPISATDISALTYCPVGFAIANTFRVPRVQSAVEGRRLHGQNLLLRFLRTERSHRGRYGAAAAAPFSVKTKTEDAVRLLAELGRSAPVYLGTPPDGEVAKPFKSPDLNLVGQPDYILRDRTTGQQYVVEEKFEWIPRDPDSFGRRWVGDDDPLVVRNRTRRNRMLFHENHLNQLRSYLFGIGDPKLSHGYLVCWEYTSRNGVAKIEQCRVKRVDRRVAGEESRFRMAYEEAMKVVVGGGGSFDPSTRSAARCAGCAVGVLCGHKTGRFDKFTFPYAQRYLRLTPTPFPRELRKVPSPLSSDPRTRNPDPAPLTSNATPVLRMNGVALPSPSRTGVPGKGVGNTV